MSRSLIDWLGDPLTDKIARVFYAATREWDYVNDESSRFVHWGELPLKYKTHLMEVVAKALAGQRVPTGKELHEECLAVALQGGWKFGPVENRPGKISPEIVPWEQLPFKSRMNEHIFSAILRAFMEGS